MTGKKATTALMALACMALAVLSFTAFFALDVRQQMAVYPDDAFYYLVPAMNIAKGLGPTADGINTTSGYHPLWMGILVVISWALKGKMLVYQAVVLGGIVLHVATAFLIFLIAARFSGPLLSLLCGLMYLACKNALYEAMGGTEAALLAFLIAAFIYLETSRACVVRNLMRGILLGLIFLARTDAVFFVGAWIALHSLVALLEGKSFAERLRSLSPVIGAAFLTVLPWFLVSYAVYGAFLQNSMVMKVLWRQRLLEDASIGGTLHFTAGMLVSWLQHAFYDSRATYAGNMAMTGLLSAVGGAAALAFARKGEKAPGGDTGFLVVMGALFLHVLTAGLFYSIKFSFVRSWYFAPSRLLLPLLAILFVMLLRSVAFDIRKKIFLKTAACVLLSYLVVADVGQIAQEMARKSPVTAGDGAFIDMANWINASTPKDAIIGAYSSGILSFFCERRVINLDGLNNNAVYDASKRREMHKLLERQGVGFLADHESIAKPNKTCGLVRDGDPDFATSRLQEIYRIPCRGEYGDIVAYRIMPR